MSPVLRTSGLLFAVVGVGLVILVLRDRSGGGDASDAAGQSRAFEAAQGGPVRSVRHEQGSRVPGDSASAELDLVGEGGAATSRGVAGAPEVPMPSDPVARGGAVRFRSLTSRRPMPMFQVACAALGAPRFTELGPTAGGDGVLFRPEEEGRYAAFLIEGGVRAGPVALFDYAGAGMVVDLEDRPPDWAAFDLVDLVTNRPIEVVEPPVVTCSPIVEGFPPFDSEVRATAVPARYEVLVCGPERCAVTAKAEGYFAAEEEALLDPKASAPARVALVPSRTLALEIVGSPMPLQPGAYAVEQYWAGTGAQPVPASGRLDLKVRFDEDPLCLRLEGPEGVEGYVYVPASAVYAKEPHPIRVGGGRGLEVLVEVSDEMEARVASGAALVRVSHIAASGDMRTMAVSLDRGPVFRFDHCDAEFANVGVQLSDGTEYLELVAETIPLDPERLTSVTLWVEREPLELVVTDSAGVPLPGLEFFIQRSPNRTGWVQSALTDEAGAARVPAMPGADLLLCAYPSPSHPLVIDVPFQLDDGDGDGRVVIALEPTFEASYVPRMQLGFSGTCTIEVYGRSSSLPLAWHQVSGTEDRFSLTVAGGSEGSLTLGGGGSWTDEESYPIAPGVHVIDVHPRGNLVAPAHVAPGDIEFVRLGVSVADWVAEGRVRKSRVIGGGWRADVPVGTYRMERAVGEEARVVEFEVSARGESRPPR